MDRNEYGRIIAEQIINDYKTSEEFKKDAVKFMYMWLMVILNYKAASLGDVFASSIQNDEPATEDAKREFMEGMEKYGELRNKLSELYQLLDDDYNWGLHPCPIGGNTKLYPEFLNK